MSGIRHASGAYAVTPHDTNPMTGGATALYVGGAGAIVLRAADSGSDVTFAAVPAGTILPVRASHVRATGTTATAIIALTN